MSRAVSRPRPSRRSACARPTAGALNGLSKALSALLTPLPGPVGDDALALRDQLHRDAQSKPQCELPLRGRD